jgi:hypothetical protein
MKNYEQEPRQTPNPALLSVSEILVNVLIRRFTADRAEIGDLETGIQPEGMALN